MRSAEGRVNPAQAASAAGKPAMHQTQRESCLRTRRTRHELGERHNVGIGLVAQPLAAVYELASEIAEMGDGSAETVQPNRRNARKIVSVFAI